MGGGGEALDEIDRGGEGGDSDVGGGEAPVEDGVEGGELGEHGLGGDVMSEVGENEESRLLELGVVGGDAVEHERQEVRPLVVGEKRRSELGDARSRLVGRFHVNSTISNTNRTV